MAELATAYITLIPSLRGAAASITKQLGEVDTSGAGKTMGGKAGGGFASGLLGAGAIAGAAAAVTSKAMGVISNSMGGAISRIDTMNNFPKVMQNLGYSSEDASKSIKKMSDRLTGLPTSLDSMTGMVQQIAPLTGGLDEATNIGLAFNDMLLASGKSTADQTRAMEQYAQMLSKGTVDLQSWRTLQEVMPGQLNQVAQALLGPTANSQSLYEAMQNGTVSMDDFNNAMLNLDQNGANGFASFSQQAKDATGGIATAFANVKTSISRSLAGVMDAIGQTNISGVINGISPIISGIGNVLVTMVNMVKASGLGETIGKAFDGMKTALGPVVSQLAPILMQFFGAVLNFLNFIIPPIVKVVTVILSVVIPVVEGLIFIVSGILNGIVAVFSGAVALIQAVWGGIVGFFQGIWNGICAAFSAVGEWFGGVFGSAASAIQGIWSGITGFFQGIWDALSNAAGGAVKKVTGFISGLPGTIKGFFSDAGQWLWDAGSNIMSGLLSGIKNAFETVKDFVSGIGTWIAEHKGPKSYDLALLIPNGQWIMQSLATGLKAGLPGVKNVLGAITDELGNSQTAQIAVTSAMTAQSTPGWASEGNSLAMIMQLLVDIKGKDSNVYLDKDKINKSLAPGMDTQLGIRQAAASRGF
jgi:tape measure domain-containing protein